MPHDQNTGGFFVCVLEKTGTATTNGAEVELPAVPPLDDVVVADEAGASTSKRVGSPSVGDAVQPEEKRAKQESSGRPQSKKQKRDLSFREEPFAYVDPENEEVKSIV